MPLCGFNEKMLKGLTAFNQGLYEHGLIERAKSKNWSLDEVLERELVDMERFRAETSRIDDPRLRKIVDGLTLYAQGVYEALRGQDTMFYEDITRHIRTVLQRMDKRFYTELEGKVGDMRQLAEYLNTQRI